MAVSKTVLITGASGLIGRNLKNLLISRGYRVVCLTTQQNPDKDCFYWNPDKGILDEKALTDVDYIIHLAGAGLGDERWSKKRRKLILNSRTRSSALLYRIVQREQIPLKAFITASATGYYGSNQSDGIMHENFDAGNDFAANVCKFWEEKADAFTLRKIRTVKIRTGVVFDKESMVLKKLLMPITAGLGGPLGTGQQIIPWISLADICGIYLKALEDDRMEGAYNAVAPGLITNSQLMKMLADKVQKPFFMPPVPEFLLKMVFGEMALLITRGNRISAEKIQDAGYVFQHPVFQSYLDSLHF